MDATQWFAEEVQPHAASLKSHLRSSFPSIRDVDDVVQESYLRTWKARVEAPILSAKAFLFRVARNIALNDLRRNRRSPVSVVTDLDTCGVLDDEPDAAGAAARGEELALLAEAIESLPPRCREIFILRRLERIPQKEIAARLGLSEQTVQVQACRGLCRVDAYLRQHLAR